MPFAMLMYLQEDKFCKRLKSSPLFSLQARKKKSIESRNSENIGGK